MDETHLVLVEPQIEQGGLCLLSSFCPLKTNTVQIFEHIKLLSFKKDWPKSAGAYEGL